jgi:adenylate cyclase
MTSVETLTAWLLTQPIDELGRFLGALIDRLIETGVPLTRVRIGLPQLHPEVAAVGGNWSRGGAVEVRAISHRFIAEQTRSSAAGQPITRIMTGEEELRHRLSPVPSPLPPGTGELVEHGMTDYFITGLPLATAHPLVTRAFLSIATDAAGGFTDTQLELVRGLRPVLGAMFGLSAASSASRELLKVYLGQNASRRILQGGFKRGTGELISAVIWFCDLRGFTTLSDTRPVTEIVALLDDHFDRLARPVTAQGGEILKFIGDAMLAIFPVVGDPADASRRALTAAQQALAAVAQSELRIGVALHVGEVMYGNIGASERLDFTVIGRAVNEVCRVESLCKEVGRPLLATSAFAHALGAQSGLTSVGTFSLKGVAEKAELFTA